MQGAGVFCRCCIAHLGLSRLWLWFRCVLLGVPHLAVTIVAITAPTNNVDLHFNEMMFKVEQTAGRMAESYAQLALSRRSTQPAPPTYGQITLQGNTLEDKVLSLAKLLRSTQLCQDDLAADQRSDMQLIMHRVSQLEEAVQRQAGSNSIASAPSTHNLKALAERLALVEKQMNDGLTENHNAHAHNAQVGLSEHRMGIHPKNFITAIVTFCNVKVIGALEKRLSQAESHLALDHRDHLTEAREALKPYVR